MLVKFMLTKKSMLVTVLYVGEITNIQFQTFSPTYMFFSNIHFSPTLKTMKMRAQKFEWNIYLNSTQVLPTPESPISKSLNKRSSQ